MRHAGGQLDRSHDPAVSATAADVAAQGVGDVLVAGVGVALEQRQRRHDHAGRAIAALHGVGVQKGLLQGVQAAVLLEAFDGLYLLVRRDTDLRDAGARRLAVQQYRAGPALAFAAAVLAARQIQVVAQHLEQAPLCVCLNPAGRAVHMKFRHRGHVLLPVK